MNQRPSRFVVDLPFAAVKQHIDRKGLVILTTGSTECHGDGLPHGTDTFIAEAVALQVAEARDGLIYPPVWYSYSGGTGELPGTVTVPGQTQQDYTRAVLRSLIRDGCRKIVHLQWHAPYYNNEQLAREIFEETRVPVAFFGMMGLPVMRSAEMNELIGTDGFQRETTVAAGAFALLGKSHLLLARDLPADTRAEPRPEDGPWEALCAAGGVVGHYYTDSSQHLAVRTGVSEEAGKRAISMIADVVVGATDALDSYLAILAARR